MQNHRDASDVVIEARRWIGTPFRHQQSHRGLGCDCVGFVRGVAENLGLIEVPAELRREFANYSRTPNPARMGAVLQQFLIRTEIDPRGEAPDGHVAWMQWIEGLPMHLAITATFRERRTLIHALRKRGVAEHGFVGEWRRRVVAYFQLPEVRY